MGGKPWRHGDTRGTVVVGTTKRASGEAFRPQMAAKTSVSRYLAVSPHLSPTAEIRAQQPPVSLEPGRPTQQDWATGEARSLPEGLGNDAGLFLGRRSPLAGDMATPATVFFSLFAGGQPDPQFDTDPVEPRNTPLSPLRGEGGFLPRPI